MSKLELSEEIKKILSDYRGELVKDINEIGHECIKDMTNETRRTAPKNTGTYKKHISWKSWENRATGARTFQWYVRAPHYRLTHLLVHGHANRNGGRVPGDPFLENAVDRVTKEYEKNIVERIKKK